MFPRVVIWDLHTCNQRICKSHNIGYGTTNADAGVGIGMKRGIQKIDGELEFDKEALNCWRIGIRLRLIGELEFD